MKTKSVSKPKVLDNHGCITCRHSCGMSGLCMMPFPGSKVTAPKGYQGEPLKTK